MQLQLGFVRFSSRWRKSIGSYLPSRSNVDVNVFTLSFPTAKIFDQKVFLFTIVQNRPPVDFDSCMMEQCNDIQNTSLDTSFNNTNQSLHSSRLSNSGGGGQNNVSFLKRRLFENEEEDDVNLLPDDDDQQYGQVASIITSTQRPTSPPQCDSETEVI